MTVYDVSKRLLGSFDDKLSLYATRKFQKKGIQIRLEQRVQEVHASHFVLATGEIVPFGLLVWSTGLSPLPLIKSLSLPKDPSMGRLLTDAWCRVLDSEGQTLDRVFAIGDCATIKGLGLPCTAQVANQKAVWLRKALNQKVVENGEDVKGVKSFQYQHQGSLGMCVLFFLLQSDIYIVLIDLSFLF
jgi:NADH dehydrogenase FAD-containing subunit